MGQKMGRTPNKFITHSETVSINISLERYLGLRVKERYSRGGREMV